MRDKYPSNRHKRNRLISLLKQLADKPVPEDRLGEDIPSARDCKKILEDLQNGTIPIPFPT